MKDDKKSINGMYHSIWRQAWGISFVMTLFTLALIYFLMPDKGDENKDIFIYHIILLTLLVIVPVLSALITASWILQPFKEITATATIMARGDFSKRLPHTRFKPLQPLVRVLNYMGDEMEKLADLNVSRIIAEKNKTDAILKNMLDGVIVTDHNMRVMVLNRVAEKWFRLNEKKVLKKPLSDVVKNKELVQLFEFIQKSYQDQHIEFKQPFIGAVNHHIFQARGTLVKDENHQPIGIVSVIRDVTMEREAERVKNELISMVAHEIKSPLTSIYGFSELLSQTEPGDSQFQEYAHVIMSESERLTDFVNKFLDLSRLESGRTTVHKEWFDISSLINRVVENHKTVFEKKKIKVMVDMKDAIPKIYGDQGLIEQVLINLFSNALKYSPENSKTGIEVRRTDQGVTVSVIDNGYGIPEDALGHIFDKFYRVTETDDVEEGGSGLGLALVKEIIEKHGGTMDVHSRLGVGSVFSFTLETHDKE